MTKEQLDEILRQHKLWLSSHGRDGTRANLREANLSRANLSGADLREANLSKAYLLGANLSGANLYEANLSGADLSGADLYRANLSGANLSGADLSKANLFGAYLRKANLSGAYLSGAYLSGANLSETKGIMVFQAGKHTAYATSAGIKIGCEWHGIPTWIEQYKAIGKEAGYTKTEIEDYGDFIKKAAKRLL